MKVPKQQQPCGGQESEFRKQKSKKQSTKYKMISSRKCEKQVPPKRLPKDYNPAERRELDDFQEAVAHEIFKNFTKLVKRSSPGPGGSRAEHWEPMGDDEWGMTVARQMARLATGDLPNEVRQALLTARFSGFRKDNGGCRILGIGGAIRRMVYKQQKFKNL